MSTTWKQARAAGRLPTVESLTPAEQLIRARDVCARWDAEGTLLYSAALQELAAALGVSPYVRRAEATPEPDALPEAADVPCAHERADGVCTICGDAPLFPVGHDMPPLPTLAEVRATFWRHYDRVIADQHIPRGHRARHAAWQELTTAEQYVLGAPDRARPRTRSST